MQIKKPKFITDYEVTPASTHDSQVIEDLIDEDDKILYADSAYASKDIDICLKSKKVKNKTISRKYRNTKLSNEQIKQNYKHSKTRVRVEHMFGTMTRIMNNALDMMCIGIKRITSQTGILNLTYNLVRYEQLTRLHKIPIMS